MNAEYATTISQSPFPGTDSELTACKDRKVDEYIIVPANGVERWVPKPSYRFTLYP